VENDIIIDGKPAGMQKIMKQMNFVEDVGYYTRRFTRIYVVDNTLFIGHTINQKKTRVDDLADLEGWIRYFDRI
jgi:hypothetical protein